MRSDGYVDFRTTGRDIRLEDRGQGAPPVLDWTVGQHLVDAVVRGDRCTNGRRFWHDAHFVAFAGDELLYGRPVDDRY